VLPFAISAKSFSLMNLSTPNFDNCYWKDSLHSTANFIDFPNPAGINAVPLTICSPFFGFTPNWIQTSTVSVKLVNECTLSNWRAWNGLYSIFLSYTVNIFSRFFCLSISLLGKAFFNYNATENLHLWIRKFIYININNHLYNNKYNAFISISVWLVSKQNPSIFLSRFRLGLSHCSLHHFWKIGVIGRCKIYIGNQKVDLFWLFRYPVELSRRFEILGGWKPT
jgi:hypothetical protein